jgi:hypothetical protein
VSRWFVQGVCKSSLWFEVSVEIKVQVNGCMRLLPSWLLRATFSFVPISGNAVLCHTECLDWLMCTGFHLDSECCPFASLFVLCEYLKHLRLHCCQQVLVLLSSLTVRTRLTPG